MSIANENNRISLTATATQTTFAYDFKIEANDEIAVYLTPDGNTPSDSVDILTLTTDYTLTGVGDDAGGNIVLTVGSFPTGAAADDVVVAIRAIDYDQPDVYVIGQDNAENLEASIDRMAMRLQRMSEELDRAIKGSITGGGAGYLNQLTLNIGDWNMDSTVNVSVAHGLDATKIRSITALIRNDDASANTDFFSDDGTATSGHNRLSFDATDVSLVRSQLGIFDDADHNATSYNRGWITINYTD